jgi:hypothetical protein
VPMPSYTRYTIVVASIMTFIASFMSVSEFREEDK